MTIADCGCVYHAEQGIPCQHDKALAVGAKVCAWCHKELTPGDPAKPVSHGICPDCRPKLEQEIA